MAFAIGERGVDQIEAEVDGAAEGLEGLIIRAAEPLLAADAPGAVADLADFEVGPAEFAVCIILLNVMVTPLGARGAADLEYDRDRDRA